jgi:arsenate reductase
MAEGFLRTFAGDEVVAVSAAVRSPQSDPLAIEVMNEVGVDISGQRAKDVAESLKEHFSCVVTVCDASKERFPVWPFTPNTFHWSLLDPETADGPLEQRREVFRQVRDEIKENVRNFAVQTLVELHAGS